MGTGRTKPPNHAVSKPGFHHGNLHHDLIRATRDLLRDHELELCTLAEACRQAQVTNAAPYRHFRSKGDLLECVVLQGFDDLNALLHSAHHRDAVQRLVSICNSYVKFATDEPRLFGLMLGSPAMTSPEISRARKDLLQIFQDCVPAGPHNEHAAQLGAELAVSLWTFVHGAARLGQRGYVLNAAQLIDVPAFVKHAISALLNHPAST